MMIMAQQHSQKQIVNSTTTTTTATNNHLDSRNQNVESNNKSRQSQRAIKTVLVAPSSDRATALSRCNEEINKTDTSPHLEAYSERYQQQRILSQDGKRTLIKNQLYLIEQLQLENANLRNERDHLQLENEELKFQLQMISSSNILGQSGTAFNDNRQLERLVENDTDAHSNPIVIDNLQARQRASSRPNSCLPSTTDSTNLSSAPVNHESNNHYGYQTITSASGLAKLTATPSRQPLRPTKQSRPPLIDSNGRPPEVNSEFDPSILARLHMNSENLGRNNKLLANKSSSASTLNVRSNLVCAQNLSAQQTDDLLNIDDEHEDDDEEQQRRSILVQQLYGDSERVHAAAITIQRAYRKHQICRRFRAITEQLRQASKTSPVHLRKSQHQSAAAISQLELSRQANNAKPVQIPFASGATRAAAWESLSLAASRFAASAASATASTKQALSGGMTKSASGQQVSSNGRSQSIRQNRSALSTVSSNNVNERSSQPFKASSVVAAAINFQQLESIRKRQYRVGLNVFNKNPEKGVSFLIAHSFIDCSPPYIKTSHSYYLSNQLHFIDKQQITAQQQSISPNANGYSKLDQNCRLCHEEENLKRNVAHFLLHRKGLAKEKIGQYLGNLQCRFNQDVLIYYLQELDFNGLQVDVALRKFSSTMRMPGEAQKIERFVDCFAQRYVQCQQTQQVTNEFANSNHTIHLSANNGVVRVGNDWSATNQNSESQRTSVINKNNLTLLTKDEIFILTFAIIMLNTDLHSPSLKSTARMSASQFINNLRGVFKSQTINEADLIEIYERVKANQITTTPDHVTHVMKVQQGLTTNNFQKKELPNLCMPHRRLVCFCRLFEVYDVNKKERVGQHQREIFLFNDMLLVTKLSRRPRAHTPQQYTYRQCIPLQGLYVQLFQSPHYNFGIRMCRRVNDETLIMFNARNELDQSRFVDDLNESIAEMDEMETIKSTNLIDSIHSKQQDRLRHHAMLHDSSRSLGRSSGRGSCDTVILKESDADAKTINTASYADNDHNIVRVENTTMTSSTTDATNETVVAVSGLRRMSAKFSSMSNLASVAEINDENGIVVANEQMANGIRPNRSFAQQSRLQLLGARKRSDGKRGESSINVPQRSISTNSVHSLDSGLFLSRDVSPNQSG